MRRIGEREGEGGREGEGRRREGRRREGRREGRRREGRRKKGEVGVERNGREKGRSHYSKQSPHTLTPHCTYELHVHMHPTLHTDS